MVLVRSQPGWCWQRPRQDRAHRPTCPSSCLHSGQRSRAGQKKHRLLNEAAHTTWIRQLLSSVECCCLLRGQSPKGWSLHSLSAHGPSVPSTRQHSPATTGAGAAPALILHSLWSWVFGVQHVLLLPKNTAGLKKHQACQQVDFDSFWEKINGEDF